MSAIRKILLFGATGRTGKHVLREAVDKGYEVVALVRSPDKITATSPMIQVIKGTPEAQSDVERAFDGCDAVVSALNNNRASDSPWAKPLNQPFLMRDSVQNALNSMRTHHKRRIVIVTAMGAGDSSPDLSWLMRLSIEKTNIAVTYRDHDAQEGLLRNSDTDWTIVRPMALSNRDVVKKLIVSYGNSPKPAFFISRKHVATFVVNTLGDDAYIHKAPVISER
jgi:putative NADH-flavin reductase